METIAFNKKSLREFIDSDTFELLVNIPIGKHRAISQINNPRADENDILLVAQFDDLKTVGYLGVLPDYVITDTEKIKIGWLTCFWVDEAYKSQGVAANLFRRVIRAWNRNIFITNIVPWLDPVYQKTKIFKPTLHKIGVRGYSRFCLSEILPEKKIIFRKIKFALKFSDSIFNLLVDLQLKFKASYKLKSTSFSYLGCIEDRLTDFINKHNHNFWNKRGIDELNWISRYPWLIQGAKSDAESERYFFSDLSKRFFYQIIDFKDINNETKGLLIVSIRNNNLYVPYAFFENEIAEDICKFLFNTMKFLKLNTITVFHDDLTKTIKSIRGPFLFKKNIKKPYFISKQLEFVNSLNFQDGDGDCAFY